MANRFTTEQVRAAQVMVALARTEAREPDEWTSSVANAKSVIEPDTGAITVPPDQVDNARLLVAIDRASGRKSEEWIVRLANSRPA